jgi:serine/threonine protein kinase/tetratricopeptide (TPR) repeat protein/TolB-like protein
MAANWARTKEVFTLALEHDPAGRQAYVRDICGADEALRAEVESLLANHHRADSLLENPGAALWHPAFDVNMIGKCVGDYRILREAGRGGTSVVYLAQRADQQYQKRVAIKILRFLGDSADILQRFRMERQTLAELDHPNIVSLLDGGSTEEGLPYLVMDYVEGLPIDRYCEERELPIAERLRIFRTLCDAVDYAHRNGVIHRDLKPNNVLVTNEGVPRLLDFGIAKLRDPQRFSLPTLVTLDGMHAMTPEYASPEQVRGRPLTAATDIYSLGVLLYVVLCGRHPYRVDRHSLLDLEKLICDDEPVRPSVAAGRRPSARELRGDLDAIAMKALCKEPERRYPSARELSDDIGRHLCGMPVTARRTAVVYRSLKFLRRHRESLTVAVLALTVAGVAAIWEAQRLRAERAHPSLVQTPVPFRPAAAVLGFKNLSGRDDTAWLATALSEMLTTELAAGGNLRMLPGETIARARIELALPDVATLSSETLKAVRQRLGSDFIVSGSYLDLGAASDHIRLDLRLQDAARGETLTSVSVDGSERQLLDLVSRSGARLRDRLGLPTVLPAESTGVQNSLPSNPDAAKSYSEGLAKLRAFDALAARDLLSRAVSIDPGYPLAHAALAQAWLTLGYDAKGREEAKTALDTARPLNRENHLLVEAGYYEASKDWPKAIEAYRTLFNFFPDNPEYGLALAKAQTAAGQGKDAMATLEKLRKLPREADFDPRVDLATVNAASVLSDNTLQANAAASAARKGRLTGAKLLIAVARTQQCRALANVGRFAESAAACEEARAIYQAVGDWAGTARVLHTMAEAPLDQGDLESAQSLYAQALAIARRIGDELGIARELGNLGFVYQEQGQWAKAEQFQRESLAASREIGARTIEAGRLGILGEIFRAQGRLREAGAQIQDSIAMAREIGNAELEAIDLSDQGDLAADQGDLGEALRQYDESLRIFRDIGEKGYQAAALAEIGHVRAEQGDTSAARALYDQALAMQKPLGVKGDLAQTQVAMAELLCEINEAPDAADLLRTALTEFQTEKKANDEIRAQGILARALLLQGQIAPARAASDAAAALIDRGSIMNRLEWQLDDARVRVAEKDLIGAERSAREVLSESAQHGLVSLQFKASLALAEIHAAGSNTAAVRRELQRLQKSAQAKGLGLIVHKAAALAARPITASADGRPPRQRSKSTADVLPPQISTPTRSPGPGTYRREVSAAKAAAPPGSATTRSSFHSSR